MSDINALMNLLANDKILKDMDSPKRAKEITRSGEIKWLKDVIKNYKIKEPEEYNLAITVGDNFIGTIGVNEFDYKNNNAEIGYWIGEPYWGKGYATLALKKFLKELFRKFKLVRIYAYVNDYNKASQKVLENCGFKLEGIRRKVVKEGNKYLNDKQYSLIK